MQTGLSEGRYNGGTGDSGAGFQSKIIASAIARNKVTVNIGTMKRYSSARQALAQAFGLETFRPLQEEIIETLIGGRDVLALMPTGGGKSLCYQVPALVRPGTAVVVSPLLSLIRDQVMSLQKLGVNAACVGSLNSPQENSTTLARLRNGALDVLYLTPERLLSGRTIEVLREASVSLFAIDEAHCISSWGHDFRPEYRRLACLKDEFPSVPKIALTATADQQTRAEISDRLLVNPKVFVASFDRPNIHYRVDASGPETRQQILEFITGRHKGQSGIVYCVSRRQTDSITAYLQNQGVLALPYHAGMSPEDRDRNQSRFRQSAAAVMVATVAFGMGIDKPDVRYVIHLGLPGSMEAYFQETGRAGRDGKPAEAWLLWGWRDVMTQSGLIDAGNGDENYKAHCRDKLKAMVAFAESTSCRRSVLLPYFGQSFGGRCGNCDNCLNPRSEMDATVQAQKFMSCVIRCIRCSGHGFRMSHIIDVLLGEETETVLLNGHQHLSTWAIGREFSAGQWRRLARRLLAMQILQIDFSDHGGLWPGNCKPLFDGRQRIPLAGQKQRAD